MKISLYARTMIAFGAMQRMNGLRLYTGPIPANGETAPTGTLLTYFAAGGNSSPIYWFGNRTFVDFAGVAWFDAAVSEMATASGTVGYGMFVDDHVTPTVWTYVTAGASGAELNLSHTNIKQGSHVTLLAGYIAVIPN